MGKTAHSHRHLHRVNGKWAGHTHEHDHLLERQAAALDDSGLFFGLPHFSNDDLLTPAHRHKHQEKVAP